MPPTGQTKANAMLERLLRIPHPGALRNVLGVAIEYADHPSINGQPNMPSGRRLEMQLTYALEELGY